MVRHIAVAAFLAHVAGGAQAQNDASNAYGAVTADAMTTAIGLSTPGVVEANPLGWAALPLRVALVEHARTLPREEAQPVLDAVSASGWGAAANNLAVLAGGGAAAPLLGLIVGLAVWRGGQDERDFWRACGVHRAENKGLRCAFRPLH